MLGIGIIGATGFIASKYRAEIRQAKGARIVALCARRQILLNRAAKEDDAEFTSTDWRSVVEHPDVDLVVVATPDALHKQAAIACAKANKHIFCEKPIATCASDSEIMWAEYRARPHLASFVPFWGRFLDVYIRAKDLVSQGLIGETRAVICRWFNPRPKTMAFTWRDDPGLSASGVIADDGSHFYDLVRWILDKEAVRVMSHVRTTTAVKPDLGDLNLIEALSVEETAQADPVLRECGTADFGNVTWEYEDGTTATMLMSQMPSLRMGFAPEMELHGTKASLAVDRKSGSLFLLRDSGPPCLLETHSTESGNRFSKHVLPAVQAAVAGKLNDHPNLRDGHQAQIFLDGALKAAQLGYWARLPSGVAGCSE